MDTLQKISDALTTITNAGKEAWSAVSHPLHSLWTAGSWLIHQEPVFVGTAIIGAILWTFGLSAGKKIMQWSIAVYALLCIVLAV